MLSRIVSFLAAALLTLVPLACQPASDNRAVSEQMFRDYAAAWSSHDIEKLLSFFADSCEYESLPDQQTFRGKEAVRAYAKLTYDGIPDFKLKVTSVFASGDSIGCEWVMTGTQTGPLPKLPPTGKAFIVRGCSIAQLKGGKILRTADYWDMADFLCQLGVMEGSSGN